MRCARSWHVSLLLDSSRAVENAFIFFSEGLRLPVLRHPNTVSSSSCVMASVELPNAVLEFRADPVIQRVCGLLQRPSGASLLSLSAAGEEKKSPSPLSLSNRMARCMRVAARGGGWPFPTVDLESARPLTSIAASGSRDPAVQSVARSAGLGPLGLVRLREVMVSTARARAAERDALFGAVTNCGARAPRYADVWEMQSGGDGGGGDGGALGSGGADDGMLQLRLLPSASLSASLVLQVSPSLLWR